jgi:Arc/MetJ-type ribon-helix-helix transcriptional regulator
MADRKMINFRIEPDLVAGLKLVKHRDGVSESEQMRRALRAWLGTRKAIKAAPRRAGTRRRA